MDKVGNVDEQVALVGGHGTLVAFDRTGTERLWTVTSDTGEDCNGAVACPDAACW